MRFESNRNSIEATQPSMGLEWGARRAWSKAGVEGVVREALGSECCAGSP